MDEQLLPKAYDPSQFEDEIYRKWEESGKFNPDNYDLDENAKSFSIVMPPPNVTGTLHTGHASMLAYQDLMVRYHRLLGDRTVWIPGTDHASIATQTKVEKIIAEEGQTRHSLGREKFLERVNKFAAESQYTIKSQVRKMGSSCDWSREKYTLGAESSAAVVEVFVRMYRDGLIYRGDRVVNWCPRCHSPLADDEVEYLERSAKIYTFKYDKDFPIAISTTRPETKLADTAVAVHPNDPRYKKFIGKTFKAHFAGVDLNIKIVGDHHVEREFGTGALGVTPAHSMADSQIAGDNDLPVIKLIDEDGLINENGGQFKGLTVVEARKAVVKWIKDNDLLIEEQDIPQNVSICYRCSTAIEPLPSLQWFIDVNKKIKFPDGKKETLKSRAIRVVEEGQVKMVPDRFENIYYHWMEDLKDWCISRQIWFGHRIPAWYRPASASDASARQGDEIYVGATAPEGDGWIEETDTLDTWFSSGLWTFSTLGWPANVKQDTLAEHYWEKNDLERFHPTSVLETGHDIIFFWVARMILMTNYALGEVPFETVYLHGLVRDEKGRKMSKSLGNIVDPLTLIPKFGTDALRLSMIIGSTPGNDIRMYDEKIEGYRNFVNKLYNISRFILTSVKTVKPVTQKPQKKTLADEWILNELDKAILEVSKRIEAYEFSAAGEYLRDFTWNTLADWYIEIAKIEGGKDEILLYLLEKVLILWHPFTPFVTEHIWEFFGTGELLMTQSWPRVIEEDIKAVDFDLIQQAISTLRNMRAENKIEPALKLNAVIVSEQHQELDAQKDIIKRLARLENLEIVEHLKERPKQSATGVFGDGDSVYLLLEGIIDIEKEKARLEKEIDATLKIATVTSAKLDNENFVKGAPQDIVEAEKAKYAQAEDKLKKLRDQLESLA